MSHKLHRILLAAILLTTTGAAATPTELDTLTEKLQRATSSATEADIVRLLQLGRDTGRPFQVAPIVKNYLAQSARPTAPVLLAAAENAWLTADYRTAVTRYKAYLKLADQGPEASVAAAQMYAIQIDFLGDKEDAYRFMRETGDNHRQSIAARRFDAWFLSEARQRRDLPAVAKRLAVALADKLPLEQERLLFWEDVDWLMDALTRAEDAAPALSQARSVVSQLRDNKLRSLKYGFFIAYLDYKVGRAGKAEDAAAKLFAPVSSSARAFVEAFPTAATLQSICGVFAGGEGNPLDNAEWARQEKQKRELFVAAFEKLNDADRAAMMTWRPANRAAPRQLASAAQWAALGAQFPAVFQKAENVRDIPFLVQTTDLAVIKQQAQFLKGVPTRSAALINALAASDDFTQSAQALWRNDAWHLPAGEFFSILERELWPAYRSLPHADKAKTADENFQKMLVAIGGEMIAKSPVALLDPRSAQSYLYAVWRYGSSDEYDKTKFIEAAKQLEWVPWTDRERREALEGLHRDTRIWAANIRKSKDAKAQAVLSQLVAIDEALLLLLDTKRVIVPAKAPTPLAGKVAELTLASRRRDSAGYIKAAREGYPLVRDYDVKKTPGGASALALFLRTTEGITGTAEFHAEVVADQLALGTGPRFDLVASTIVGGRSRWGEWRRVPREDQAEVAKINAAVRKALLAQLDKGQFVPAVFELFRATRQGDKWSDYTSGEDVLEKMITKKTLLTNSYRPNASIRSAAVTYQWLVRSEFPKLAVKYPVESAFDDLLVEEAQQSGFLDGVYWQYGKDAQRKVANAAAQQLQRFDTAPLGYGDAPAVYSRDSFWDWHARAMNADAALRDALLAKLESWHGKTRFDGYAMGAGWFAVHADTATRAEYFAKLGEVVKRLQASPTRQGFLRVNAVARVASKPETLTDAELTTLRVFVTDVGPANWYSNAGFEDLVSVVQKGLLAKGRRGEFLAVVPHAWRVARNTGNASLPRALAQLADAQLKAKENEFASALSAAGLELMNAELPADSRTTLVSLRSQSLLSIGGAIPVERNDPRYPVYAAQSAFNAGNFQNAWEIYAPHAERVLGMIKELDPRFTIWLINENAKHQQFDGAETLARQLLPWMESAGGTVDAETRARLLIAYANISFERREYPKARALFERIVAAEEFDGTQAKDEAELRIAESDRLTKQYDKAFELLDKLTRRKNRSVQMEAFYQLARLKYEQEDFQDARQFLDQVFMRAPDHAEGRILEGNLDLKMKRLIEATEVKVGLTTSQRILVPGRPLKVRLEDQNLSTVGKAVSIEIRAWTESGDEEVFNLVPFGDSKTKFEGSIGTALAAVEKGDKVLQVLGDDVIRYDYSDRFKKAHNVTSEPFVLNVATDSELYASSGRILSRDEVAERQMEELLREKLQMEKQQADKIALSFVRPADQVKPGNKINVRVVDPDRSTTAGADTVLVKVQASSGDAITGFMLKETDTHSGIFEGSVPTASAQATAVASNSEEGKQPSFPISAGDHPAWVALADNIRPKLFSVDLNDNVVLGKLNVRSDVAGHKLKKFSLQTSLNGRDFTTLAAWPQTHQPWGGELTLAVAKLDAKKTLATPTDIHSYLQFGHLEKGNSLIVANPKSLAVNMEQYLAGKIAATETYVAHLRGAFYLDSRQVRTLRFDRKGGDAATKVLYYVDGEPVVAGGTRTEPLPPEVKKSFAKGVHRLDIYVISTPKAGVKLDVLWDIEQAPYMAVCPIEPFDPARYPQIREEVFVAPAQVTAGKGNESFDFTFAPNSRARVVRFVLEDFETDSPAISRVTLHDAAGKQILPTQQDLTKLKENKTLEIIPGDKITITYEDPKVITAGRNVHQAGLSATYMNASIKACFADFGDRAAGGAERKASYVPVRRFSAGDPITVVISDPDMDISEKQDAVKFTAKTTGSQPVMIEALETDPHSGVFVGNIFPVRTAPQRSTELQVREADDITVTYLDMENTDPGVPWARNDMIEQAVYVAPQLRLYDVTSQPLAGAPAEAGKEKNKARPVTPPAKANATAAPGSDELYPATRSLLAVRPKEVAGEKAAQALLDGPVFVEVLFPTIALSQRSTTALYVQTAAGRAKHGKPLEGAFDTSVPGTIKLISGPSDVGRGAAPTGYASLTVKGDLAAVSPLDDGRFAFNLPVKLGEPPTETLVKEGDVQTKEAPVLLVKGGDEIFVGYEFKDDKGQTQWLTGRVVLGSDVFLDVMDRKFQEEVTGAHVGENIYFRVVDKSKHITPEKDEITIEVKTSSGKTKPVKMLETFGDTGVFKGYLTLAHAEDRINPDDPVVLPVQYGETVTLSYRSQPEGQPVTRTVLVYKGADGNVLPFTKRFKEPEIAVQTQFTIAESWFELAKKHRELGEESLARREIGQGKKVLEEVLRDYPDTKARAQADYLLANLALEFANMAVDADVKRKHYMEAIGRFTDIVASFAESPYAPKSQFKKALTFEKMGEIDQACEEYVKLSYRYPDNELVAETIARLGQYFFTKAKLINEKIAAEKDKIAQEKLKLEAQNMFTTAAEVFGRLAVRFPSHALAAKTTVLSAQCYMRAENNQKAVQVFRIVTEDVNADKEARAEAMYWCGDAYMKLGTTTRPGAPATGDPLVEAYRMFKRLTWDFPETKWAKFARGRLTEPALATVAKGDEK